MIRALTLILALCAAVPAWAITDPSEALRDPAAESRAVSIGRDLRCLVCQNESIEDSGADLARDLRKAVREQVIAGKSDTAITAWMVARYGDFVRLSPPFRLSTLILWGSPLIAVAVAVGAILLNRRRNTPVAPLDPAEQTRLSELMRG